MANKQVGNKRFELKPSNSLVYIDENGISEIPSHSVTSEVVGEKAFGLSCLPKPWTPPFVVVSGILLSLYRKTNTDKKNKLLLYWAQTIFNAVRSIGLKNEDQIIVRSSGCTEGIGERGKFYSIKGTLDKIIIPLVECLEKLASDRELADQKIPLVVQKCVIPASAKGHLSNERRWYEEKRDWLGQYEEIDGNSPGSFKINLRNWREQIPVYKFIDKPLYCNLSAHIAKVLKGPAAWIYDQQFPIFLSVYY